MLTYPSSDELLRWAEIYVHHMLSYEIIIIIPTGLQQTNRWTFEGTDLGQINALIVTNIGLVHYYRLVLAARDSDNNWNWDIFFIKWQVPLYDSSWPMVPQTYKHPEHPEQRMRSNNYGQMSKTGLWHHRPLWVLLGIYE